MACGPAAVLTRPCQPSLCVLQDVPALPFNSAQPRETGESSGPNAVAIAVPIVVVAVVLLALAAEALLLLRRRRQRRDAGTAGGKGSGGGSRPGSIPPARDLKAMRSRLKASNASSGLTSFEYRDTTDATSELLLSRAPSGRADCKLAVLATSDGAGKGSGRHAGAAPPPGQRSVRISSMSRQLGVPASAKAAGAFSASATDFDSDAWETTGCASTTLAKAMTSISSASPAEQLEDALDQLYFAKQPFMEHYELLSAVERRTGGQGAGAVLACA